MSWLQVKEDEGALPQCALSSTHWTQPLLTVTRAPRFPCGKGQWKWQRGLRHLWPRDAWLCKWQI